MQAQNGWRAVARCRSEASELNGIERGDLEQLECKRGKQDNNLETRYYRYIVSKSEDVVHGMVRDANGPRVPPMLYTLSAHFSDPLW
jgi:hypothetical protein